MDSPSNTSGLRKLCEISHRFAGFCSLVAWLRVLILCCLLVGPLAYHYVKKTTVHYLEIALQSDAQGPATVYFDTGSGFSQNQPATKLIYREEPDRTYRFILPESKIHSFRVKLSETIGKASISSVQIVSKGDVVVRILSLDSISAESGVKKTTRQGSTFSIQAEPATAAVLTIKPSTPVDIRHPSVAELIIGILTRFVLVLLAVIGAIRLVMLLASKHNLLQLCAIRKQASFVIGKNPRLALAALALGAVVINCYPIVFLGRSFVSPNYGTGLLYERAGTLPGCTDTITENPRGSDVGAMIWYYVPVSVIQHRAIFKDGELPLWNRYNSTGVPLLGQGQSMIGDPFHMIVVAANGAAWAWDIKFMLAKWMLALGLGLIVYHGTSHFPSAALTILSAPFVGFFLYRLNHPTIFSFCYAPWILYCWCGLTSASSWRNHMIWCVGLLASCWIEISSGTVKEAYMSLVFMNLSGLIVLATADCSRQAKKVKLLLALSTGILFVMISAPIWMTFLDTLKESFTLSKDPQAFQMHPVMLLGLFDEIFYRPLVSQEGVCNPSANFFVLLGVLYAFATFRHVETSRLKIALALAAIPPFAFGFGVIPPEWIVKIPFIANIVHISDVFAPILIIHLIVLAGFGCHAAIQRLGTANYLGDLVVCSILLGVLVLPYIAMTHTGDRSAFPNIYWTARMPVSPFIWYSLVLLPASGLVLALVTRRSLVLGRWSELRIILTGLCLLILLWRHGPQARIGLDPYVFHPATRADFHVTPPVVKAMSPNQVAPVRAVGFEGIFFPGWTGVYNIEGVCGPDALINPYYRELLEGCGFDRPWEWRYAVHLNTLAELRPVYDFLNIKYYLGLNSDEELIKPVLASTRVDGADQTFSSESVWPRAFFTDQVATYETPAQLGQMVRTGDGRPFAAIQAADKSFLKSNVRGLTNRTIVPATNYRLTGNTTSFKVVTDGPGLVVLQEAWLKHDFYASVNGRPAKYHRINHAFKGIEIDVAGTYQIFFGYWPRHLTMSLVLAATGVLLVIAGVFWLWNKKSDPAGLLWGTS